MDWSRISSIHHVVKKLGGKINKGTFDVVSIGHIKTLDSFSPVKDETHSRHLNAIFEARVLQSLAGCEYFLYVFGVFDRKLVMELITYEDDKVSQVCRGKIN